MSVAAAGLRALVGERPITVSSPPQSSVLPSGVSNAIGDALMKSIVAVSLVAFGILTVGFVLGRVTKGPGGSSSCTS